MFRWCYLFSHFQILSFCCSFNSSSTAFSSSLAFSSQSNLRVLKYCFCAFRISLTRFLKSMFLDLNIKFYFIKFFCRYVIPSVSDYQPPFHKPFKQPCNRIFGCVPAVFHCQPETWESKIDAPIPDHPHKPPVVFFFCLSHFVKELTLKNSFCITGVI